MKKEQKNKSTDSAQVIKQLKGLCGLITYHFRPHPQGPFTTTSKLLPAQGSILVSCIFHFPLLLFLVSFLKLSLLLQIRCSLFYLLVILLSFSLQSMTCEAFDKEALTFYPFNPTDQMGGCEYTIFYFFYIIEASTNIQKYEI